MKITLGDIVFGCGSDGGAGGGNWTEDKEYATAEAFCTFEDYVIDLDNRVYQLESSSGSSIDFTDVWYIYAPANCQMTVVNQDGTTQVVTTSNGIIKYSDFPNGLYAYSTDINIPLEKIICMGKFDLSTLGTGNFDYIYSGSKVTTTPSYIFGGGINSLDHTWSDCEYLTSVPNLNTLNTTKFTYTWSGCANLLTIPPLNFESAIDISGCFNGCGRLATLPYMNLASVTNASNAFDQCDNLTTLGGFGEIKTSFDLRSCSKLTVESLMNVINQAATGVGGRMVLGNANLNKLTDAQKAVATSKGWSLVA